MKLLQSGYRQSLVSSFIWQEQKSRYEQQSEVFAEKKINRAMEMENPFDGAQSIMNDIDNNYKIINLLNDDTREGRAVFNKKLKSKYKVYIGTQKSNDEIKVIMETRFSDAYKKKLFEQLGENLKNQPATTTAVSTMEAIITASPGKADDLSNYFDKYNGYLGVDGVIRQGKGANAKETKRIQKMLNEKGEKTQIITDIVKNAMTSIDGRFSTQENFGEALKKGFEDKNVTDETVQTLWAQLNAESLDLRDIVKGQKALKNLGLYGGAIDGKLGKNSLSGYRQLSFRLQEKFTMKSLIENYENVVILKDVSGSKTDNNDKKADADLIASFKEKKDVSLNILKYGGSGSEDHFLSLLTVLSTSGMDDMAKKKAIIMTTDELNISSFGLEELKVLQAAAQAKNTNVVIRFYDPTKQNRSPININLQDTEKMMMFQKLGKTSRADKDLFAELSAPLKTELLASK